MYAFVKTRTTCTPQNRCHRLAARDMAGAALAVPAPAEKVKIVKYCTLPFPPRCVRAFQLVLLAPGSKPTRREHLKDVGSLSLAFYQVHGSPVSVVKLTFTRDKNVTCHFIFWQGLKRLMGKPLMWRNVTGKNHF